jgi:hypothetical protein
MTNPTSNNVALYRQSAPEEGGFINDADEYTAMRDFTLHMVYAADPHDLMDTILTIANVCEARAITADIVPERAEWYRQTGRLARAMLTMLRRPYALPNIKLENPALYFPDAEGES